MIKFKGFVKDVKIKQKGNAVNVNCRLAGDQYAAIAGIVRDETEVIVTIEAAENSLFDDAESEE